MIRSKPFLCTAVLVLAVLFKFWLISGLEITDDPDDPPNYVRQILAAGPSFFGLGTGLFGSALRSAGIPFRLGIEVAFLIACLLVTRALFASWPWRSWLALAMFLIASFNPAAEELFSHIMSDQVWLVETLAGLGLFVMFAGTHHWHRWLLLALAAVCLGFANITRMTLIPLVTAVVVWAVLFGVLLRLKHRKKRFDYATPAGWAGCLAVVVAIYYAACSYNSSEYGYFGISLPDSREFQKFYMTLQSVGEADGTKYYPIDDHRLGLVAQAGPASQWFVNQMHTDLNFRRISEKNYGRYDYALTWFDCVVFFNTMPGGDLQQGFAMFRTVEQEVAQAAKDHRLNVRPILPLPDCRLAIVASALPDALWHVGGMAVHVPGQYAWAWRDSEPSFADAAFTDALSRRPSARSPLREDLGAVLCGIYAPFYTVLAPAWALSLLAVVLLGLRRWDKAGPLSFHFIAQRLFEIFGVALFLWYTLFDASGLMCDPRYVIYPNVLLPLLLGYNVRLAWRLTRSAPFHPDGGTSAGG